MFGSMFAEGDLKVIHLLHEHRPSVFYKMKGKLDEYIAYRHQVDADFPESRAQLEGRLGCKFVFHNGNFSTRISTTCSSLGVLRYIVMAMWTP